MLRFFRESIKEFDHVVWPTHAETRRYFTVVLSVIVSLAIILFIASSLFSAGLFGARKFTAPVSSTPSSTASQKSDVDLSKLLSGVTVSTSGSTTEPALTVTPVSTSGSTK